MAVPSSGGAPGSSGPRFNKKPALIAVGMAGLFLVAMMYAAQQRAQKRVTSSEPETVYEVGTSDTTIDFLENRPDGLVGVNRNDIGEPAAAESTGDRDRRAKLAQWLEERELARMKQQSAVRDRMASKQLEDYEAAMRSSSKVEGITPRERDEDPIPDVIVSASVSSPYGAAVPGDPFAAAAPYGAPSSGGQVGASAGVDPARLGALLASPEGQALVRELSGGGAGVPGGAGAVGAFGVPPIDRPGTDRAATAQDRQFVAQAAGGEDEFVLEARSRAPRSPYELKTGALIPGAMISAANSDLPGDILAQVTQNVYDTASGRYVVIPQGTKLFGRYDAYVALGQERLLIVWNRLVFPDGETLDIGGMQGYDSRGLAGFNDRVNTHFLRTLANALLISVVSASGEALVNAASEPDNSTFTVNLAQDFSDTTSQAFNEYLRNRLRIQPTLEIRSGYRFNIIVSKDIDFDSPYERGFAAYRVGQ